MSTSLAEPLSAGGLPGQDILHQPYPLEVPDYYPALKPRHHR
jgi:hypothetical protein